MRTFIDRVAILDAIAFDLATRDGAMQVKFAMALVHPDGRVERQYHDDRLVRHLVRLERGADIDAIMEVERRQIEAMGYDPPTYEEIDRIKRHCAIEWERHEQAALPPPPPMEFVPFNVFEKVATP